MMNQWIVAKLREPSAMNSAAKSKKREAYADRQAQKDREREERERAEVMAAWLYNVLIDNQ